MEVLFELLDDLDGLLFLLFFGGHKRVNLVFFINGLLRDDLRSDGWSDGVFDAAV